MIQIKNVSKSYGTKQVLYDITLDLAPGKCYGIVGQNGAGKTTLFKCITGLEPYSGDITGLWQPLKDRIGYLPTIPYYFSMITGREYVRLLCNARGIQDVDIEGSNIFDLPLSDYASTYSTGMKKKLSLTGILLQQNEFYLLDEPFNGVDIQSNIVITAIIERLKNLGKTILLSSHIFSTLQESCDSIYLLEEGRITETVEKNDFVRLEEKMKQVTVGNRIDRLGLK